MKVLYYISVYLHIVSAMIWVGGMIFLALIVVPVVKSPAFEQFANRLIRLTGERFRRIGWGIITTLVITGTFNAVYRVGGSALWEKEFWGTPFGLTLSHKLFFVGIIIIISAIHDFSLGPKASKALEEGESGEAEKLRKRAGWLGRVNLLLSLIVVFLAIMLVRGGL